MTSDRRRHLGDAAGTAGRGRDAWSLSAEKLARRIPRLAEFLDGPESGHSELTEEQREFLDKFSSGLSEALSEQGGGSDVEGVGGVE